LQFDILQTRVDTIETTLTDDDTHLPTSGAVYDAISDIESGLSINFGSVNQVPYMNSGGDDFNYASNFTFNSGILTIPDNIVANGGQFANWITCGGSPNYAQFGIDRIFMNFGGNYAFKIDIDEDDSSFPHIAYTFDTQQELTHSGSFVAKFGNYGTDVMTIDKDGNINIPSGSEYRINGSNHKLYRI